jgi:hypothetical protein
MIFTCELMDDGKRLSFGTESKKSEFSMAHEPVSEDSKVERFLK